MTERGTEEPQLAVNKYTHLQLKPPIADYTTLSSGYVTLPKGPLLSSASYILCQRMGQGWLPSCPSIPASLPPLSLSTALITSDHLSLPIPHQVCPLKARPCLHSQLLLRVTRAAGTQWHSNNNLTGMRDE